MNVKEAREHLLKHGYVFSLRPKRRKRENCIEPLMYKEFGKKGTVYVGFMGEIKDNSEVYMVSIGSGFKSGDEWLREANGSKFLYAIRLIEANKYPCPFDNDFKCKQGQFCTSRCMFIAY